MKTNKTKRINGEKFIKIGYDNGHGDGAHETFYPVKNLRWLAQRMTEIGGKLVIQKY